ncbi:MAG: carboxypeptidase-like regulatory domain-containing protein [Sporichthyaceae bacterium]|nr:carboxypeptidase-like regulatory domain-containing protein [Sporichthyaceae bacterium]
MDFVLTPGVAIDGVVTDEGTGDPVPDTCISAYDPSFAFASATCTDQDGHYVLDGLESGVDYRLEVLPPGSDLVGEWAFHKTSFEDADPVTAPATVNIPLRHGDRIDGTVTGDDTGEPIEGICVRAFFAVDGGFADIDCTNAEGKYALGVAPGFEYRVEADGNENYAGGWAFDKASEEEADLVTSPAVVNFGLARLGQFTGTLTMPDGTPAAFATVSFWDANTEGDFVDSVSTDEAGQWSIAIRPGDYKIQASAEPFIRWALDAPTEATADVFSLDAGEVLTVDMQFPPLATIQGRVTEAGTSNPIAGICVRLFAPDGTNPGEDCTGADGRYSVNAPEGSYAIRFHSADGKWVTEWHRNVLREQDAELVPVGSGAVVKVNAGLKRGGKITGRLVDPATDAPLADLCVTAVHPQTLDPVESMVGGCSDAEGRYTISGLPAGKVLLRTPGDRELRPEAWAPGVPTASSATKYVIVSGATTHAGKFRVPIGGIVRGRVTNAAGEPLAGIVFIPTGEHDRSGGDVRTAVTNANGEYQLDGLSLAPFCTRGVRSGRELRLAMVRRGGRSRRRDSGRPAEWPDHHAGLRAGPGGRAGRQRGRRER